ncbi:MAG: hypothetical protein JO071_08380 [Deltaproteobacteria bacterium]|nr:hypothetical protein [Deltaproteobacteria bacterium]
MIPRWYARTRAFAWPEYGSDYFLTDAHYRSLAARIIATLGGFDVVVVTGDPPPDPQLLSTALTEAGSSHTILSFSCRHKLQPDELLSLRNRLLDPSGCSAGIPEGPLQSSAGLVLVFDYTSQSDVQIDEVLKTIYLSKQWGSKRIARAVFLAAPDFLARLDKPALRLWLAERLLVARLRLQELGGDEVPAFIRHQLPFGEGESALTSQAVAAIAEVSGGDPVLVNRFARRLLGLSANAPGNPIKATPRPSTAAPVKPLTARTGDTTRGNLSKHVAFPNSVRNDRTSLPLQAGPNLNATVRISLVILAFLIAFGGSGALLPRPAEQETTSAFTGAIGQVPVTDPEHEAPAPEASRPKLIASTNTGPRPATDLIASSQEAVLRPTSNPSGSAAGTAPAVAVEPATAPLEGTSTAPTALPKALGAQLLPETGIPALIAQGDRLLDIGDVASARLFYERAADAADGKAALRLAKTFDPAFLRFSARLSTVRADSMMAAAWYRRARDLGQLEAEIPLKRLDQGFPSYTDPKSVAASAGSGRELYK